MEKIHSLLKRQLKKLFGEGAIIPEPWKDFLATVNDAYHEFDMDRNMLERSLELSSQELLQKNSELRVIFEAIPDLVFRFDHDGKILDCKVGNGFDLILPQTRLIGSRIDNIPQKVIREQFKTAIQEVLLQKKMVSIEYKLPIQGQDQYYEARLLPLLDNQIVAIVRNVSEQKTAESVLKEREARLERENTVLADLLKKGTIFGGDFQETAREAAEAAAHTLDVERISIWLYDEDGLHMRCIDLYERSSGTHRIGGELLLSQYPRYFKALEEERAIMTDNAAMDPRTSELFETYLRPHHIVSLIDAPLRVKGKLAGILRHEHVGPSRSWSQDDRNFAASMADVLTLSLEVAERKQKEELLKLTQFSVDHARVATFWLDAHGQVLHVNREVCASLGYIEDEMKKMTIYDWDLSFDPVDRPLSRYDPESKGSTVLSTQYRRKDGSTFPVEVHINTLDFEGKKYFFLFARDITERKQAEEEKERLQSQLLQMQKLEAIGTLAGGIAHDFNNLLMGIQGYVSLVRYNLDSDSPYHEQLLQIEDLVRSGADLTKQLLGFARGGKYEIKPKNINTLLQKTSEMFARTRKEITIHHKYAVDLLSADCDQGQMEQVFLNLYVNAWQAMPGGGDLYLETNNVVLDPQHTRAYGLTHGRYVKISITDSGLGMNERTKSRIFEPFFTTKEMGRGTGLGLASVYGIIKNHAGAINVYSEIGFGTTFNIYLPSSGKEPMEEKRPQESIKRGTEQILLIDDQDHVLKVGQKILERLGYTVLGAGNGEEALVLYKKNQDKIRLVILDMIMPGMNGSEVFEQLKKINPEVKVLLSSGYSLNGEAKKMIERGVRAFIQKPFTMAGISQKVREILDDELNELTD